MLAIPTYLIADSLLDPSGLTDLLFSAISFAIIFATLSVVFYVAGNIMVGTKKVCFKDAFAISVLGTLVLIVCLTVFSIEFATIMSLFAWLLLVRYYYETGILRSVAVGATSVVVAIAILIVLSAIFGYSIVLSWFPVLVIT